MCSERGASGCECPEKWFEVGERALKRGCKRAGVPTVVVFGRFVCPEKGVHGMEHHLGGVALNAWPELSP